MGVATSVSRGMWTAKALARGMLSYLPHDIERLTLRNESIDYARYCYSVWFRHMVVLAHHGLRRYPRALVEVGPGSSLGVGLTALISGAEDYYGLDVGRIVDPGSELTVFDRIVEMLRRRERIPASEEFPLLEPRLGSYVFPDFLFESGQLEAALAPARIRRLRDALANLDARGSAIHYVAPWEPRSVPDRSVDLVLSHAVMERIEDLPLVYGTIARWLEPNGFTSHSIDFAEPRTSPHWNGNWTHPDWLWMLMRGRRSSWGNRLPRSAHVRSIEQQGLQIVAETVINDVSGLPKSRLASAYRDLSDEDLTVRAAFIVARNPE